MNRNENKKLIQEVYEFIRFLLCHDESFYHDM